MINLIGFDGPAPHCIIFWQQSGDSVSKTVCYEPSEALAAINRFYTQGDFYNSYDNFVVEYGQNEERKWA